MVDIIKAQAVTPAAKNTSALQLKIGQVVLANVLEALPEHVRLQIGRQQLNAQTALLTQQRATPPNENTIKTFNVLHKLTQGQTLSPKDGQVLKQALQSRQFNTQILQIIQQTLQGRPLTQAQHQSIQQAAKALQNQHILVAGQQIQLKVEKGGAQPVLKLLTQTPLPTLSTAGPLKQLLPKQLPLQTVLSSLTAIAKQPVLNRLPAEVKQAVIQLLSQLSDKQGVQTSEGVKQALQQSGLFFESRLLQTATAPPRDFKGNLLVLFSLLNQALARAKNTNNKRLDSFTRSLHTFLLSNKPPLPITQPQAQPRFASLIASLLSAEHVMRALQKTTEGALARLQVNQLAHHSEDPGLFFNTEIPIYNGKEIDLLHIQFEKKRKKEKDQEGEETYAVSLALDLQGLGPIHAKITLQQDTLNTTFWAESDATAERIRAHLPLLQASLQSSGFDVQQLSCYQGTPPPPATNGSPPMPHLLDEHI